MATNLQHFQAYANLIADADATQAQLDRLANAMAHEANVLAEFLTWTNAQRLEWCVQRIRRNGRQRVKAYDGAIAAATAESNSQF